MGVYKAFYPERLMSAEQAVALIPAGSKICMGPVVSEPPALLQALTTRIRAGDVGDLQLYYMLSGPTAARSILDYELRRKIRPYSLFHGGEERARNLRLKAEGQPAMAYIPTNFSEVPHVLTEHIKVDTLLTTVSPMDEAGNFSLGTNVDYVHAVSRRAKRVILEVNPAMPHIHGNCMVHISQVTAVVENFAPLVEVAAPMPKAEDLAIAKIIAGLVEDGACLQMGIGALPNAVCTELQAHRHFGIHTELMTPGLVELVQMGIVDNSRKKIQTGRSVFTFALGDKAFYDFLGTSPYFEGHPVEYVNNPWVIAQNDKVLSVNAALQVDLQGACNSEYMQGAQYSAAGGQLDFVRGAYASKGGKSIIACHSTAAGGKLSRIVPRLEGPVTTPRNDTHIVVTEYGWVDLKGLSLSERGRALIAIAHPKFREELEKEARAQALRVDI
jgi:itaconate CoA-transferase